MNTKYFIRIFINQEKFIDLFSYIPLFVPLLVSKLYPTIATGK